MLYFLCIIWWCSSCFQNLFFLKSSSSFSLYTGFLFHFHNLTYIFYLSQHKILKVEDLTMLLLLLLSFSLRLRLLCKWIFYCNSIARIVHLKPYITTRYCFQRLFVPKLIYIHQHLELTMISNAQSHATRIWNMENKITFNVS